MDLVIDNFAGGGGASEGIERALGRSVDYAINHDAEAIAMHRVNHPNTRHLQTSVWDVDPRKLIRGRHVGLGWFSPDCTFHSKARGGKPFRERDVARRRRGLAGIVPRWLSATGMLVFMLENVEEFADWGPLLPDGRICPKRRGMLFRRWHRQIENTVSRQTGLPYRIDMRELRAMRYGAPTTRKRLFVIGRCDGHEIVFPEATHGHERGLQPYRTAADCIDWSIPCPSIFSRKKPLVDATLRRIARGVMRYVVNSPTPFIVGIDNKSNGSRDAWSGQDPLRTITTENRFALVAPSLINTRNGERAGQAPRVRDVRDPFPTVTAIGSQGALVAAFLARHYGGHENDGSSLATPMHTVTAKDHHSLVSSHIVKLRRGCVGSTMDTPLDTLTTNTHYGEVRAFLMKYYGTDQDPRLDRPLDTITTKDRFGLVTTDIGGDPYAIVDIGMRMLNRRELFNAQSFGPEYVIDHGIDDSGNILRLNNAASVRMCGNSVPPAVAEALVRANVVEQREMEAA
jgi:DNA (cytosine-5)-methyltransferase 1